MSFSSTTGTNSSTQWVLENNKAHNKGWPYTVQNEGNRQTGRQRTATPPSGKSEVHGTTNGVAWRLHKEDTEETSKDESQDEQVPPYRKVTKPASFMLSSLSLLLSSSLSHSMSNLSDSSWFNRKALSRSTSANSCRSSNWECCVEVTHYDSTGVLRSLMQLLHKVSKCKVQLMTC